MKDHQERLQQFEDFIAGFALWINTLLEREKKDFVFHASAFMPSVVDLERIRSLRMNRE